MLSIHALPHTLINAEQLPAIAKSWDKGAVVVNTSISASRVFSDMPFISMYACSKAAAEMMVSMTGATGDTA